jgi:hypothetical protein
MRPFINIKRKSNLNAIKSTFLQLKDKFSLLLGNYLNNNAASIMWLFSDVFKHEEVKKMKTLDRIFFFLPHIGRGIFIKRLKNIIITNIFYNPCMLIVLYKLILTFVFLKTVVLKLSN